MPWAAKSHQVQNVNMVTPPFKLKPDNPLLPKGSHQVWMSHGDRIEELPRGFSAIASSTNSPIAAMGDFNRGYYGVQFHPEVRHTPDGLEILRRFVLDICQANADWTPESIIQTSIENIRNQVGSQKVLSAVSGGVDSSVATALVHKAIGDQLSAVFINHGMLRLNEQEQVEKAFLTKPSNGSCNPELAEIILICIIRGHRS